MAGSLAYYGAQFSNVLRLNTAVQQVCHSNFSSTSRSSNISLWVSAKRDEVATFLQKVKHLPWLTSAKQEQKKNGQAINMTRMSFESLEAIENLQLQLVEMNKLAKQLQLEIGQLKSQLNERAPKN